MKFRSNWQIYSASLSGLVFFLSVLKSAKVFPNFRKDSKLDYSNYCPISLLSSIEKTLEKLMYKRLCTFLNNNNIIYKLDNNIPHSML